MTGRRPPPGAAERGVRHLPNVQVAVRIKADSVR